MTKFCRKKSKSLLTKKIESGQSLLRDPLNFAINNVEPDQILLSTVVIDQVFYSKD